ncbi:MAG: T9SS type A sorting domain-containing protein [Saprospiraceae bacterium]|nr:T9SS type A sorting domain-containing protein [Saprospiraceae bacterium]
MFYISYAVCGQTPSGTAAITAPSASTFAEVGVPLTFTATLTMANVPAGKTTQVTSIEWTANTGGSSNGVPGKINNVVGESHTITTNLSTTSSVPIIFGDFNNNELTGNVKVVFNWTVLNSDGSPSGFSRVSEAPLSVGIRRVFAPVFPSPNVTIQKCCNTPVTITVTGYKDANAFIWAVSGATYTTNGPSVTITPNSSNPTGNILITCVAKRSQAISTYSRPSSYTITRTNPVLEKDITSFKQTNLCRNNTYSYKLKTLCGATNYSWTFPSGWTVQAGQGSQTVTVSTNASASSGNVTINATLTGGCTATVSYWLNVITTPPNTPQVSLTEDYDTGFQCGQWQICPNGTMVYLVPQGITETYTYQVTNPWRVNGLLSVTTSDPFVTISYTGSAPTSGVLTFRATNCVGSSGWNNYTFSRQMSYWCTHSYPVWCECCQPPCDGCPPYPLFEAPIEGESQVVKEYNQSTNNSPVASSSLENNIVGKLLLQPNPAENEVSITLPNATSGISELVSMNGEILGSFNFKNTNTFILPLKEITSGGMYLLRVTTSEAILTEKLLITR